MPIYEYECPKCGEKFEMRRGFGESDDDIKCPKCGAKKPRRALSMFASGGGGSSGGSCTPVSSGGG